MTDDDTGLYRICLFDHRLSGLKLRALVFLVDGVRILARHVAQRVLSLGTRTRVIPFMVDPRHGCPAAALCTQNTQKLFRTP
jgi:hypothetical protein